MPHVKYNVPALMLEAPTITDYGRIADPEGFSSRPFLQTRTDLRVNLAAQSNGLLCLDKVPENFHAVIRQAEAIHNADRPDQPHCAVHLFQGELLPGRNFGVIAPHIDSYIHSYPENDADLEDNFIISDALTTPFYRQGFKLPANPFAAKEDIYWKLSDMFREQAKPECRFIAEPHHLIRFSALAVHESQLPDTPTFRTAAILRFH